MKLRPVNREILAQPQPKQAVAIGCPADVVLFGGAVGGGKSEALKLKMLQHERKYGKWASMLLLRASLPELSDLQKRLMALLPRLGCTWFEQKKEWHFPSGAVLYLGYLESEKDAKRYWGKEYSLILLDEVGHYATSAAIDQVASRLRSTAPPEVNIHCQLYMTANPGGAGHSWLKAKFIDNREPCKIWTEAETGLTYCYIPSYLTDNKYLASNTKYIGRVKASGPSWFVRALLRGDWSVSVNGDIFSREWFMDNRYKSLPPKDEVLAVIQSWDMASKDKPENDRSACTTWAITEKGVYLMHAWAGRLQFPQLLQKVKDLAERFNPALILVEDASAGIQLIQTLKQQSRLPIHKVTPLGKKAARAMSTSFYFESQPRRILFPAERAEWLDEVIEEMCGFGEMPHDDLVDSVVQAITYVMKRWRHLAGLFDPLAVSDAITQDVAKTAKEAKAEKPVPNPQQEFLTPPKKRFWWQEENAGLGSSGGETRGI